MRIVSFRLDKNENYFTIQLIFVIIHKSHYIILINFYLYLQYFQ